MRDNIQNTDRKGKPWLVVMITSMLYVLYTGIAMTFARFYSEVQRCLIIVSKNVED